MKARLIICLMLTSMMSVQAQYTTTKSHTVSRTARTSGLKTANDMATASHHNVTTSVLYYDRFGRPVQTIGLKGSPNDKDMVSFHQYNSQGVETRTYLPYASAQSNGFFVTNPTGDQASFYSTAANVGHNANPWSDVVFEDSPMRRLLEQGGVGDVYQLTTGRTTKQDFGLNTSADQVLVWELTSSGGLKLNESSYYAADKLDVLTIKPPGWVAADGNDGTSKTFLDYLGRKILQRSYNGSEVYDTYYVYDDLGNVHYVIPPEAVRETLNGNADQINNNQIFTTTTSFPAHYAKNSAYYYMPGVTVSMNPTYDYLPGFSLEPYPIDEDFIEQWVFRNTYDAKNQLIAQKVPGAEEVHFVYDKAGRLIMSQDGNQRLINQWTFTKYDRFERPILTGNVTDSRDRDALTAYVATEITAATPKWFEEKGSAVHGYTNRVFPYVSNENDYLIVTYYDDYDFKGSWGSAYNHQTNSVNSDAYIDLPIGEETGGKIKVLGSSSWIKSVNYFDANGFLIQSVVDNNLGHTRRFIGAYDFIGNVTESRLEHKISASKTVTINERFEYDHNSRLEKQWHSVDDEPEVLLAAYVYNEMGEAIESNYYSDDNGSTFMQSLDTRFDIHGRMTHLNDAARSSSGTNANDDYGDQFGMEFYYESSPSGFTFTPQYNGQLAGITWSNAAMTGADQRGYKYVYDKGIRLTSASYKEKNGGSWNTISGHYDVSITDYDYNGNIERLTRKHSISGSATTIDDLVYTYEGNQLKSVNDQVNHVKGFADGAELSTEYTYDANGNLLTDSNKFITGITYNQFNLPEEIVFSSGDKFIFTYDASGDRLKQEIIISGSTSQTYDYSAGLLLDNGELAEVAHAFGRVKADVVGNDYAYDYQFFMNDHLGNTRAMVAPIERTYLAGMEDDRADQEEAQFLYVSDTRYTGHAKTGSKSSRLNAYISKVLGPAKAIRVYTGDQVEMSVYAKHASTSGVNETSASNLLLSALSTAFGVSSGSTGEALQIYNGLNAAIGSNTLFNQAPGDVPKAFINYIFFDKDYNYESFGAIQVNSTSYTKLQFANPFTAPEDGYVFVYLSNESTLNANVYFDDLEIIHTSADAVLQTDDYYPFGMPMDNNGFLETGVSPNRFLYQGKEWQTELGLNLYDFHARQFDPALGRFLSIDPQSQFGSPYLGMGNIPTMSIDPDGELAWFVPVIIGAAIGGATQGIAAANAGGSFFNGFWKGALIGGAAGLTGVGATAGIAGTTLAGTASAGLGATIAGGAIGGAFNGAGFAALNGGNVGMGFLAGAIGGGFGSAAAVGAGNLLGPGGGFVDGFARGALSGGATGGVGAALSGNDVLGGILQGAVIGGAIGGTIQGIEAKKAGASFLTGKRTVDISNGVGAHNVNQDNPILDAKYKGKFEDVNVFESGELGYGRGSGGVTLPGIPGGDAIFVGTGVFSRGLYPELMQHEFGHILQARRLGNAKFYAHIGKSSLISATKATYLDHNHNTHWTETWANYLSKNYFGASYIPSAEFPIKNIGWFRLWRLSMSAWSYGSLR